MAKLKNLSIGDKVRVKHSALETMGNRGCLACYRISEKYNIAVNRKAKCEIIALESIDYHGDLDVHLTFRVDNHWEDLWVNSSEIKKLCGCKTKCRCLH